MLSRESQAMLFHLDLNPIKSSAVFIRSLKMVMADTNIAANWIGCEANVSSRAALVPALGL